MRCWKPFAAINLQRYNTTNQFGRMTCTHDPTLIKWAALANERILLHTHIHTAKHN